jgi:hypothetical protein
MQTMQEIIDIITKKEPEPEKKPELYRCPKFEKCIMDCHHRQLHEKDKWCESNDACPNCVPEIESDITFFEEDFEL